jgi:hypothetical protein
MTKSRYLWRKMMQFCPPKRLIDKSQAYFWTSEWQVAEREADADIVERRVYKFDSVELAITHLREILSESNEEQTHHDLS